MIYSKKLRQFKNISHSFFNSKGGCSTGIYKSLNCGFGSNDKKINVTKNLKIVSKKIGCKISNLVFLNQVHSNKFYYLKETGPINKKKIVADALITKRKKIIIGVLTADCVPILIFDEKKKIVSAIHAGWKGAFSDIIKNTINQIRKISSNNLIYACVGPCIGKKSYEVDLIFYEKFVRKSKKNRKYFSDKGKIKKFFNLRKYVTDKLLKLKVKVDQIDKDTFTQKSIFFSYRRSRKLEQKDYGRCISVISLV